MTLVSPLLKTLGILTLFITIGFIVWSWTRMTTTSTLQFHRSELNSIGCQIGRCYFKNSNIITQFMNHSPIEYKPLPNLFVERKLYTEEYCKVVKQRKQNVSASLRIHEAKFRSKVLTTTKTYFNRRNWIFIKSDVFNHYSLSNEGIQRNIFSIEWCPVYKAASSPWMAIFGKLSNILTPHTEALIRNGKLTFIKLFKDLRLNIPYSDHILGKESKRYKMIIVRHPFVRLLSAYRDKLERIDGRDFYYKKYGYRILRQFRFSNDFNKFRKEMNGNYNDTFHSLLSQMFALRKVMGMTTGNETMRMYSSLHQYRPTFGEFVQYLLSVDPRSMDEHWRPIYLDCNPCQYAFDLILKVETMDEDRDTLFNLLPLRNNGTDEESISELKEIWKRWSNKGRPTTSKNNVTKYAHYEQFYFSQLTKFDLKLLYEKYEPDFLLFNYSPKYYFSMGQ